VQAQVQSRGRAGRGEQLPVVYVQHIGPDVDSREHLGKPVRRGPVRSRGQAVQQTGGGQGEGTAAD
jgi:hypothetical protein